MRAHYDIPATIRYYGLPPANVEVVGTRLRAKNPGLALEEFDLRRWKEPPHVALANLRLDDLGALEAFTRRYGVVNWVTHPTLDPLGQRVSDGTGGITAADVGRFRDYLRKAWAGDRYAVDQMLVDITATVRVGVPSAGLDLVIEDLWTLTRLMFLRDWRAGRTKVCASPDCPAPFFVAVRKSHKFCSHPCAVLVNVRRFRESKTKGQSLKEAHKRQRGKHAKEKKA